MADAPVIPGLTGTNVFAGSASTISTIANYFAIFIMILVVGGATMAVFWLVKKYMLDFNIPVVLDFEVGGTIISKNDKAKIRRHADVWEIKFKKNGKLKAEVPNDECAFFKNAGLKTVKCFRGFVRDNQVAWTWPTPQTKVQYTKQVEVETEETDKDGKITKVTKLVPTTIVQEQFITMPANMIRFHVEESRRNAELNAKLKWWQNPQVLAFGAMGFMVIALIFIYLLYKSVPDQINAYIAFASTHCGGAALMS